MITIKIVNTDAVIEKNKGWFVANVVGTFIDLESRLEQIVIAKLRESLAAEGIEAEILQTTTSRTSSLLLTIPLANELRDVADDAVMPAWFDWLARIPRVTTWCSTAATACRALVRYDALDVHRASGHRR